jgi:hypothetical protein
VLVIDDDSCWLIEDCVVTKLTTTEKMRGVRVVILPYLEAYLEQGGAGRTIISSITFIIELFIARLNI